MSPSSEQLPGEPAPSGEPVDDPRELAGLTIRAAAGARGLALLVDYDGTLSEIAPTPAEASPRQGAVEALTHLAARADVRVAVISGRGLDDLARHVRVPGAWLAGAHGAHLRAPDGARTALVGESARPALQTFLRVARALAGPRAILEDKEAAVAVHLRGLEQAAARALAADLEKLARPLVAAAPVEWTLGKAVVELRARGATKGRAAATLLDGWGPGWHPVAVGDDLTDEDLLAAVLPRGGQASPQSPEGAGAAGPPLPGSGTLGRGAVTIKVGPGSTVAHHRLADPAAVERWLLALADEGPPDRAWPCSTRTP